MNNNPDMEQEPLEEDELLSKVPSKYRDIYDSDDFEKFSKGKDWWD